MSQLTPNSDVHPTLGANPVKEEALVRACISNLALFRVSAVHNTRATAVLPARRAPPQPLRRTGRNRQCGPSSVVNGTAQQIHRGHDKFSGVLR
ncbi:hypothetical protein ON010_g7379 [Phytophthora cinnamomi]|nr:hypothetical protein ON010_g7379 [Phytophthora cinnamomi]